MTLKEAMQVAKEAETYGLTGVYAVACQVLRDEVLSLLERIEEDKND